MVLREDQEESKPLRTTVLQFSMTVWSEEDNRTTAFYQKTALLGATQFEKVNDQHVRPTN